MFMEKSSCEKTSFPEWQGLGSSSLRESFFIYLKLQMGLNIKLFKHLNFELTQNLCGFLKVTSDAACFL